jgi:hypothetical protein
MEHLKITRVDNVMLLKGRRAHLGTLHLTAHQLIFRYAETPGSAETPTPPELWVFYTTIHEILRAPVTPQMQVILDVKCRHFVRIRLLIQHETQAAEVISSLTQLAHVTSPDQFFAYDYFKAIQYATNGWSLYDPVQEYTRQGISSNATWRITNVNQDYALSPTYPAVLVVPSKISDSVLKHAAKHRSKARFPVVSYLHRNGAVLARCSQPMVGLAQNRSVQDEKLVEAIFGAAVDRSTTDSASPLIVDARPVANAMANTAKGAGTENMEFYKGARKEFMGIDNIHVMRDSLQKMVDGSLLSHFSRMGILN